MFLFPPWPGWDGLHPLVVHFPIALLMVAPIFVAVAVARPRWATCFGASALVLLVLGTAAAFVALETGEAAAELVTRTDAINVALEAHSELAETAATVFAVLTVLYAGVLLLPVFVKRLSSPRFAMAANMVMLVLLLGGAVLIANVGHRGGMLVHKHGVHAMIAPGL